MSDVPSRLTYLATWSPANDAVSEACGIFRRRSLAGGHGSLGVGLLGLIDCPIQAPTLCFLTAEVHSQPLHIPVTKATRVPPLPRLHGCDRLYPLSHEPEETLLH